MKRDELYKYYNSELRFIRRMAADFSRKHPAVAGQLLLEPDKCEDPHVERLIEAFAMLAARVHLRIDDEFREITDALLETLYPQYLAPIPSMTIVQLHLDPQLGKVTDGVSVDRHSVLYSRSVDGVRCPFRTCYPLTLWPLEVISVEMAPLERDRLTARLGARSALRLILRTLDGGPISEFAIEKLRFFLDGDRSLAHSLYELLFRDCRGVQLRMGRSAPVLLGEDRLRPVGFEKNERLLEDSLGAFPGYRLLQEYFCFPDKFLFAELSGLDRLAGGDDAADSLEISVLLERSVPELEGKLRPENFRLGCTPAVNLFAAQADPIHLNHQRVEYQVHPDRRHPDFFEVHSLLEVSSTTESSSRVKTFRPLYALQHGAPGAAEAAFWTASRRPSIRKGDEGTDLLIALVDSRFQPATASEQEVLHVKALCTNRDLPNRLPFGNPQGDFQLEGCPELTSVTCLRKPTQPLRPSLRTESRWRLVSHLNLNHLSLTSGLLEKTASGRERAEGMALEALREILKLYDFSDSPVTQQRIEGLVGLRSRRVTRKLADDGSARFARGVEVELEFDESKYTGSGVFLFASVLDRFLGLYTSINSFTQTVASVRQRQGILKRWPPRAGYTQIL